MATTKIFLRRSYELLWVLIDPISTMKYPTWANMVMMATKTIQIVFSIPCKLLFYNIESSLAEIIS